MEMNTRLQVEHPVTEAITGTDLVEWQLRVASGEPLPLRQDQLSIHGWAMEARLYAENPTTGFLPSTGPLTHLKLPDDIRVDAGVRQGDVVTPHYDPMIAKLIVHRPTRTAAAAALAKAAASVQVWPVRTNAAFLARCAGHQDFVAARIDTGFIERHLDALIPTGTPPEAVIGGAAAALSETKAADPWHALAGFRLNAEPDTRVAVTIAGATHLAQAGAAGLVAQVGAERVLFADGEAFPFAAPVAGQGGAAGAGDGAILSPMPGRIVAVTVAAGDRVTAGQRLVVLEAMKMEQALLSPFDGIVADLSAREGAQVAEGVLLARITKDGA